MRRLGLLLSLAAIALSGCGGSGGAVLLGIGIAPAGFDARVDDALQLVAAGTYSGGVERNITTQVTWTSGNAAVGAVSADGVFTALGAGETQVSAARGAITSDPITINVAAVPDLPTAEHFPLGFGFRWEYTGTAVSPGHVAPADDPITLTQSVHQQVVRDGTTWFDVLVKGTDPLEPPGHLYLRHDPEGLMRSVYEGSAPLCLLDASLAAGAAWEDPEDARVTFLIESTSEHVDVPAGSFDACVKVVQTDTYYDPPNIIVVWFKAGVGIVKEEVYEGATLISEQELVEVQFGTP